MRVAVVGLGLAGLRAAQLLERGGADVSLFDARERVGGRVHTAVAEGRASHEAGAQWIDAEHRHVLGLLAELGLAPRPRPEGAGLAILAGERSSDLDPGGAVGAFEALAREMCLALPDPLHATPERRALDAADLAGFLRQRVADPRAQAWLTVKYRADEGEDLDRVGLLGWLVGYRLYAARRGDEMCALRLPVSGAELCARLLATLSARPRLGHLLTAVETAPEGVTLHFGAHSERFDEVVLALPPPLVSRLTFRPALPAAQSAAHRACGMGRAVKLAWEFDAPWWRDAGWNGDLAWDGPLQQTWDGSIAEAHVLCAYVCGEEAVAWTRRTDPVGEGLALLASLFPEAGRRFRAGHFHDWVHDPFSGGVHSHLPPGFVLEHLPHLAQPAGRVHFAGEHTATWTGFMEGALESGARVSREILAGREAVA